jgi:hypothetical protein
MIDGTKVVCIDDNFPPAVYRHYVALPEEGKTYVLRAVRPGIGYNLKPEISVLLVGIVNPCSDKPPHPERGFNIERFRPLEEIQQENEVACPFKENIIALLTDHSCVCGGIGHPCKNCRRIYS